MRAEFDLVAAWNTEAILARPDLDPIPGACNGSGTPAGLGWIAAALGAGPTMRLLDVGAGLGGPIAWLAREHGLRPFAVEPMARAALGSRRLFGHLAVCAWSDHLPIRSSSFDGVLALAVLSTVPDKEASLEEARRVLRPGGSLGLLEYVAVTTRLSVEPDHNDFLTPASLDGLLRSVGFEVVDSVYVDTLDDPPDSWREAERGVQDAVSSAHRGDRALADQARQRDRFGRLLSQGALRARLMHAVREA